MVPAMQGLDFPGFAKPPSLTQRWFPARLPILPGFAILITHKEALIPPVKLLTCFLSPVPGQSPPSLALNTLGLKALVKRFSFSL